MKFKNVINWIPRKYYDVMFKYKFLEVPTQIKIIYKNYAIRKLNHLCEKNNEVIIISCLSKIIG